MSNKEKTTLQIKFANSDALEHFATWLCAQGEQQYWEWMEYREQAQGGDITVTSFHYHGEEDETKAETDPRDMVNLCVITQLEQRVVA